MPEKNPPRRDLRRRLLALGGLVVMVGGVVGILFAAGLVGSQGGGTSKSGIEIQAVTLLPAPPAPERGDLEVGAEVGKLAPDFEISDFDGNRHRLSDFRGGPVYVNFWATWCGPCVTELPDMFELLQRHQDNLAVLSVNRAEPVGRASDYFQNLPRADGQTGVSFTINGLDPDDTLYNKYRGLGMPVSVFIDADGVVTSVHNGLIRLPQMEEAVAQALASGPVSEDEMTEVAPAEGAP